MPHASVPFCLLLLAHLACASGARPQDFSHSSRRVMHTRGLRPRGAEVDEPRGTFVVIISGAWDVPNLEQGALYCAGRALYQAGPPPISATSLPPAADPHNIVPPPGCNCTDVPPPPPAGNGGCLNLVRPPKKSSNLHLCVTPKTLIRAAGIVIATV